MEVEILRKSGHRNFLLKQQYTYDKHITTWLKKINEKLEEDRKIENIVKKNLFVSYRVNNCFKSNYKSTMSVVKLLAKAHQLPSHI